MSGSLSLNFETDAYHNNQE